SAKFAVSFCRMKRGCNLTKQEPQNGHHGIGPDARPHRKVAISPTRLTGHLPIKGANSMGQCITALQPTGRSLKTESLSRTFYKPSHKCLRRMTAQASCTIPRKFSG